ncbi:aminotransferase class V-fold PLP-dependent enzyme [Candidatus Hodarchaeum mangrovi]
MLDVSSIREDFPALHELKDGKPIIYADSACMSLKPKQVINALVDYYSHYTACAGRSPHAFSRETTRLYNESRKKIATFINAKDASEVVWVRNTTEALNLGGNILNLNSKEKPTIITTSESHNSNLVKWVRLESLGKINLIIIPTHIDCVFDIEKFTSVVEKCSPRNFLASLNHISNVTAAKIPVKELGKIVHENEGILQLDAAQSFPHTPIDVQKMEIDLLGASMHKALGPTGVGILYGKYDLLEQLEPLILGGETVSDVKALNSGKVNIELLNPPSKFEAGLQDYAGAIGSGAAIDYLNSVGMENIAEYEVHLANKMLTGLEETLGKKIQVLGPKDPKHRAALAAIDLKGINPHEVAILMDEMNNIFLRSGYHCAHYWHHTINLNEGTLRPSWYLYNTVEEIEIFIETLEEIISMLT